MSLIDNRAFSFYAYDYIMYAIINVNAYIHLMDVLLINNIEWRKK